jgi:hypothetical protein
MQYIKDMSNKEASMVGWQEVSQQDFYRGIGPQNVHPLIVGPWPYTSLFRAPSGEVRGKVVDFLPEDSSLTESRYYLPA